MRALFDDALTHARTLERAALGLGREDPLFCAFAVQLRGGARAPEAWRQALAGERARGGYAAWFEPEDAALSERLIEALSGGTRASAREQGERLLGSLERLASEAETACRAKARVYQTLGVLLGAGVCILLL